MPLVYSPCCTFVILQEIPVALERTQVPELAPPTRLLLLLRPFKTSIYRSPWSLGVWFLFPGMFSLPISASGTLLDSARTIWTFEHSLTDCLSTGHASQACGLLSPAALAQVHHSILPAALCPALCWPLKIKMWQHIPAVEDTQCAKGRKVTTGQTGRQQPTYSGAQRKEGRLSGERDLSWASKDLMGGWQKGHPRQREEQRKEEKGQRPAK